MKSGETDRDTLLKLRIQTPPAPPPVAIATASSPFATPRTSGALYLAIACGTIVLLGLAAGIALFLMQR
jgi:hypothetical protein